MAWSFSHLSNIPVSSIITHKITHKNPIFLIKSTYSLINSSISIFFIINKQKSSIDKSSLVYQVYKNSPHSLKISLKIPPFPLTLSRM